MTPHHNESIKFDKIIESFKSMLKKNRDMINHMRDSG